MTKKMVYFIAVVALLMVNPAAGFAPMDGPIVNETYPIEIVPDKMAFVGDVTAKANCVDAAVCGWVNGSPAGTILLGVDPASPNTADWDGGSASMQIVLPKVDTPTRLVLKISWPVGDGKGLHSPVKNRVGSILLDGNVIWEMRTTRPGVFGDSYGTLENSIVTTLVIDQTATHTLAFQVQANTAWDISQVTISAYTPVTSYQGIGYSPYRDCQMPGGAQFPAIQNIEDDIFRLKHTTNAIRTYSSLGPNAEVPARAIQAGLAVFPGAWLDYPKTTKEQDDAEIQGLIALACSNDVKGVIVGNEYVLRHRESQYVDYLQQRIQQVRDGIKNTCGKTTPITTAEIDNIAFTWPNDGASTASGVAPAYQKILDSIDFFMIHIYPFWSGLPIGGAAGFTIDRFESAKGVLQQVYAGKNKGLMIGETGWPSGGEPNVQAVPSEGNQRRYLLELLPLAEAKAVDLLYFDAFDELWKYDEGGKPGTNSGYGAGQRWGYAYTDRTAKHNFYGMLLPAQELPEAVLKSDHQIFLPILQGVKAAKAADQFVVYGEWPEGAEHFVPSGWMGDISAITMYGCDRSDPRSGEMAIRASYTGQGGSGWAGVYWLYPESNWGERPEGLDIRWANKITFWAKGAVGGETVRFFAGGLGEGKKYRDSLQPQVSTDFIKLTNQWTRYTIDLRGKDLSHMIGGFGWVADRSHNSSGITFYLDDITYVTD